MHLNIAKLALGFTRPWHWVVGPGGHTASQRAQQASPHAHTHPLYLCDRGAVPLTGGGLMHHPLGKEPFQAHVIIQDHLQERSLGGGGERMSYARERTVCWRKAGPTLLFLTEKKSPLLL